LRRRGRNGKFKVHLAQASVGFGSMFQPGKMHLRWAAGARREALERVCAKTPAGRQNAPGRCNALDEGSFVD
jgi:hypothetical protein